MENKQNANVLKNQPPVDQLTSTKDSGEDLRCIAKCISVASWRIRYFISTSFFRIIKIATTTNGDRGY